MGVRSVQKKTAWTAEDRARHKALRDRFQKERPDPQELAATGEYTEPVRHGAFLDMIRTLSKLKKAREKAGLSLAEVSERSNISKSALSRLENGHFPNPTIDTLWRYAEAVGQRIVWTVCSSSEDSGIKHVANGRIRLMKDKVLRKRLR